MEYQYKTRPFDHQDKFFKECRDLKSYAEFWEQGTGKTKLAIDNAGYLYLQDKIDCLVIVAPPGVERNWLSDELPTHMPDAIMRQARMHLWRSAKHKTKAHLRACEELIRHRGLSIFAISYAAFNTPSAKRFIWRLLQRRRVFYVIDESHHIKAPDGKRAQAIVASAVYAEYRRALTGTAVPEGPMDAYMQFKFLYPNFWRERELDNFAEYKQYFGVWSMAKDVLKKTGRDPGYDKLLRFRNLGKLLEFMRLVGSRVLKDDVLDLPPKVFMPPRRYELSPEQQSLYDQLTEEYIAELDGKTITAELAIVRLLRLQQITCGYVQTDEEEPTTVIPGEQPRLGLMEEYRDTLNEKTIVWARFRPDIDQLTRLLGDRAVRYDGAISDDECERSKNAFQRGDAQYIVSTQSKGCEGNTWHAAHHVLYYSQSFRLFHRLQSEDRAHRAGLTHSVDYTTLCAMGTVDEKIDLKLHEKLDIFATINGDTLRDWL